MRCLIVEDDFVARKLMQRYLSDSGDCDIAIKGSEAIEAFRQGLTENKPYDLICLDIMMPKLDGHQALKAIRELENEHGINGLDRVKVIMTTALGDSKNVMCSFNEGCEAYLVKPIEKKKLFEEMEKLGLSCLKTT